MEYDFCIVTTTFTERKEAQELSQKVLENRLASCVQISSSVESVYWWQDEIETSIEFVVAMKTAIEVYQKLEDFIKKYHSYDTPEVIATPII